MTIALSTIIIIQIIFIVMLLLALRKANSRYNDSAEWEKASQEAIDEFDFAKAASVMKYLNWTWIGNDGIHVPDENDIRAYVHSAIDEAIAGIKKDNAKWYHVESGGYEVIAEYRNADGKQFPSICIKFVVEASGDIH